jgi:hypothetical protein
VALAEDARGKFARGDSGIKAEALATIERRADSLVAGLKLKDERAREERSWLRQLAEAAPK